MRDRSETDQAVSGSRYFFQIEVTTVCNFRCFYCVGRNWQPRHMEMETFSSILRRLPRGPHTVSLQGEGEPLAHPEFWSMAERVVDQGFIPYTITNGSLVDPARMSALFPSVGFSLDTLDEKKAATIGRKHLRRVLARFDRLCEVMSSDRIVVYSVDIGQELETLRTFLASRGVGRHVIQPLQAKEDYRQRYADRIPPASSGAPALCRHLARPSMRYFDVMGRSLPCCYIKNASLYVSDLELKRQFAAHRVPAACRGCRELGAAI